MVTVEVSITGGGLGLFLVGLPDNAVKESEQRIRSAFENSGYRMTVRKCVVNLAPADLRKEGSGFDLPIAVAILAATEQLSAESVEGAVFVGELSLDGSIRGVKGVLPVAAEARAQGFSKIYVPQENAAEAAVVEGIEVYAVESLAHLVAVLSGEQVLEPTEGVLVETVEDEEYVDDFDALYNPEYEYLLVPVWQAEVSKKRSRTGRTLENFNGPDGGLVDGQYREKGRYRYIGQDPGYEKLLFNAQTGELLNCECWNPKDTKMLYPTEIITWEDVQ